MIAAPGLGPLAAAYYSCRIQTIAQRQERATGEAANRLIEEAAQPTPPPGPEGQGTLVNRYA